jgi:3-oxoacyl-[acyl-carrier protein] reductase
MVANLKGKVALVTGSARGIGAATASRLAADGAAVAVNYVRSADKAEAVADRIRSAGGKVAVIQADVGDWSQAQMLVQKTAETFGRFDILVNNAVQTVGREPLDAMTEEFTHKQFAVNVIGPIATSQAAAPLFPKEGGRIINMSSVVATYPVAQSGVYSATKGGLEALTRALSAELGRRNVTVNAISVGFTKTDLINTNTKEQDDALIALTPLGRIGMPEDLADAVSLLASSDARWITGQLVHVSGGIIPSGYF